MNKILGSAIVITVVALISFSVIAVAAADRTSIPVAEERTIQSEVRGVCEGIATVETRYSLERSAEFDSGIGAVESIDHSESLRSAGGTIALLREFYAHGSTLDKTTVISYIAGNSSVNSSTQLVPVGMERSEQTSIGRTVVQVFSVDEMRLLCPFHTEQLPIVFGDETAQGYSEQDVEEILITTRTVADVEVMEIFYGINSTGLGICSAGMRVYVYGATLDNLTWETETRVEGYFELEVIGLHKGLTIEEQYGLSISRPTRQIAIPPTRSTGRP